MRDSVWGGVGYIAFALTSLALHHYNGLPEVLAYKEHGLFWLSVGSSGLWQGSTLCKCIVK